MLELPCDVGDELWRAAEDDVAARCLEELAALGFRDVARDLRGYFSSFVAEGYPIYHLDYRRERARVLAWVGARRTWSASGGRARSATCSWTRRWRWAWPPPSAARPRGRDAAGRSSTPAAGSSKRARGPRERGRAGQRRERPPARARLRCRRRRRAALGDPRARPPIRGTPSASCAPCDDFDLARFQPHFPGYPCTSRCAGWCARRSWSRR